VVGSSGQRPYIKVDFAPSYYDIVFIFLKVTNRGCPKYGFFDNPPAQKG
jgi:hypothetical protein